MGVEDKREKILEAIYDEMSHKSNFSYSKELAEAIKTIEAARLAEKEFKLKEDVAEEELKLKNDAAVLAEKEVQLKEKEFKLKDALALTDNANKELDRAMENKLKRREVLVNAGVALGSTVLWMLMFAWQLKKTRKFEETGTETSAASRWLKNSFPKPRVF